MGTIYLLHFDSPISDNHTTQHYIGYSSQAPAKRLATHRAGFGARLTQVAIEKDITFDIVRAWWGSRSDERKFKNMKQAPRYCPICQDRPSRVTWLKEKKWRM